MKIRAYLALMVAASLIPVIVFSALALGMLLKAERDAALRGVRETARATLISIDRELSNAESALRALSSSQYLDNGDLAAFYEQAGVADKRGATWTVLLDEHGKQLINTAFAFGTPMPAPAAATRVRGVLDAGVVTISNLMRGAATQAQLVVVDFPVTTKSGKRFVLTQGIRVEYINHVLAQISAPASWRAAIYDRIGTTIADTSDPATHIGQSASDDVLRAVQARTVGVIRNRRADGSRLYTVLDRSNLSGWTVAIGVPEGEIESAARKAILVAALGLCAAIGCAAMAALFFARRLSRAIAAAARSAHALGRGAESGAIVASGVAEIDDLQAAIVEAGRLVDSEQRSRQLAEQEREKLFASEHAARTMAEQQNRAKDEFLAMLGHELRNPLSAITNAVNVIGYSGMRPDTADKARQIIYRQSKHLTRIVDDLLDAGRVHSGKILLERKRLRFDLLVATYVETLKETGRTARHGVVLRTEQAWIDADPTRMEQIVANLLDNAIKYTPAGGQITVDVRAVGDSVMMAVADTGVGIAPELRARVFELFVQGSRALDRAQGGLGVGLALVRRLAELHGGSIAVHSDGVGKGSRFELRLPRAAAAAPDTAPARGAGVTRERSVLLVEDNDDGRNTMAMMLASRHYRVLAAADGPQGLALAKREHPDIALIDIGLPGMDGYEVARRLRADPVTAQLRLIALTGYGLESDRRHALDAGFDVHLVKPVDMQRLIEALETA